LRKITEKITLAAKVLETKNRAQKYPGSNKSKELNRNSTIVSMKTERTNKNSRGKRNLYIDEYYL